MKKYLFTFLIIALSLVFSKPLYAATVTLEHAPATVDQQQQFYVDVMVDPTGKSFNGVQGAITFSTDTLSFVRAETGTSNVTLFIDQPNLNGNTISFSGIIPGGFDGQINPFDPANKGPAEIVRLVFEGKAAGSATIDSSQFSVTDNDGHGTLETIPDTALPITVTSTVAPSLYVTPDTTAPILSASVVSDADLYDGKYTLIFTATDKQSGVDHVELQEGDGPWITIQSPYLLQDQSRHSILSLRAYDVAGNVSTITIAPIPSASSTIIIVILVLIALLILYVIYKKIRHKKTIQ